MENHVKRVHRRFRSDIVLGLIALVLADVFLFLFTTGVIIPKDFPTIGLVASTCVLLFGALVFSGARIARRHRH